MLQAAGLSVIILAFVAIMNSYRGIPNPVLLMGVTALVFSYLTTNT